MGFGVELRLVGFYTFLGLGLGIGFRALGFAFACRVFVARGFVAVISEIESELDPKTLNPKPLSTQNKPLNPESLNP